MTVPVAHDTSATRFTAESEGQLAELAYRLEAGSLVIEHTGVPEAIGGRGIAGALVKAALDYAREAGLRVVPSCSYAAEYIRRHPEYADLVDA